MTILQPPGWPRPKGYSNGIMSKGRMIFTAGVIGWNEREMLVSHRLDQQFAQALRNIVAILAEGGMGVDDICHISAWLTDRAYLASYMVERDAFLTGCRVVPASTLLLVAGFSRPEFKVEIEVMAASISSV